ncbi:hypothetical protein BC827DRAFT_1155421 [Russula dissimulans]|nr:hypothetical protein BC827DRAFT_1155421 [Russula dissimulans]
MKMRSYETAAHILLITSVLGSTLAAPSSAPEVHVERALTAADIKTILKTTALTGVIGGVVSSAGTLLQKLFIHDKIDNSSSLSRRSPVALSPLFPLEVLTSRTHQQASRGLGGLSDRDLLFLSAITRRAIEELD